MPNEPAPATSQIRCATDADIPRATRTLTRAFADYPWTRHTLAAEDHERRLATFQDLFLTRIGLPHGRVWVADDGDAVAVWTTPATDAEAVFTELAPRFTELAGDRAAAHSAAEAALAPHRPTGPVWFLGTVGVDPARRGHGLGRAVIEPGLAAAEREGVPVFLETSTAANVRFYEHLGFRVSAEMEIPDSGPRTWCMLR